VLIIVFGCQYCLALGYRLLTQSQPSLFLLFSFQRPIRCLSTAELYLTTLTLSSQLVISSILRPAVLFVSTAEYYLTMSILANQLVSFGLFLQNLSYAHHCVEREPTNRILVYSLLASLNDHGLIFYHPKSML
jgi:hypothetical protein